MCVCRYFLLFFSLSFLLVLTPASHASFSSLSSLLALGTAFLFSSPFFLSLVCSLPLSFFTAGSWVLLLEVWRLGPINVMALVDRVTQRINQILHQYLMETALFVLPPALSHLSSSLISPFIRVARRFVPCCSTFVLVDLFFSLEAHFLLIFFAVSFSLASCVHSLPSCTLFHPPLRSSGCHSPHINHLCHSHHAFQCHLVGLFFVSFSWPSS